MKINHYLLLKVYCPVEFVPFLATCAKFKERPALLCTIQRLPLRLIFSKGFDLLTHSSGTEESYIGNIQAPEQLTIKEIAVQNPLDVFLLQVVIYGCGQHVTPWCCEPWLKFLLISWCPRLANNASVWLEKVA